MKITAVIMAGGKGERFWPKSRTNMPKQFLSLTADGKTMIQHTVERIQPLVELEDIFVVTNKNYKDLVIDQLQGIPEENILLEPMAKNTAPCIGLAAVHIQNKYKDAIMVVLPSDHLIKYNELFIDTLKDAIKVAEEEENIATIGIMPSYPEIGYGYIHFATKKQGFRGNVYEVINFVEKPDLETAKEYLVSGKYLWNSGMFVWKVSTILNSFKTFLPNTYDGLLKIGEAIGTLEERNVLENQFSYFESESIDYGIMEKATNIYTIPGSFGWDDVGSWKALERINKCDEKGNMIEGTVILVDTNNSIIQAQDKLIATVGVNNIIIIETPDAMLICNKDDCQSIKKVIEQLKNTGRDEYL